MVTNHVCLPDGLHLGNCYEILNGPSSILPSRLCGSKLSVYIMELKVWVDGVQRVVCGVTEQTSCQDVVIALAQAIGQTGRYVLIQTLREKERQLLPHEKPLEFLSKSGQYANDVHFVLKRTGPSLTERPLQTVFFLLQKELLSGLVCLLILGPIVQKLQGQKNPKNL
ncbi:unnamed protein product [Ranitomeya imitator]|uniref:Ras-associating domain-containing protein n=1 Tax=Ranitomeya imitator TaxID=111125 RepID=A0ABN9LJN2_9NEOB|nr:unnamed protein product [Ranitomeya imitator]